MHHAPQGETTSRLLFGSNLQSIGGQRSPICQQGGQTQTHDHRTDHQSIVILSIHQKGLQPQIRNKKGITTTTAMSLSHGDPTYFSGVSPPTVPFRTPWHGGRLVIPCFHLEFFHTCTQDLLPLPYCVTNNNSYFHMPSLRVLAFHVYSHACNSFLFSLIFYFLEGHTKPEILKSLFY